MHPLEGILQAISKRLDVCAPQVSILKNDENIFCEKFSHQKFLNF